MFSYYFHYQHTWQKGKESCARISEKGKKDSFVATSHINYSVWKSRTFLLSKKTRFSWHWVELHMCCMLFHHIRAVPIQYVCVHNPPMRCPDAHLSLFLTRSSFHGVCVSFLHARLDWLPRGLFLGIGPGTQIK